MNRFIQTHYDHGHPSNYNNYKNHPLLPLTVALEPLLSSIDQLYYRIQFSKNYCNPHSTHNLTIEESAAVYLYADERDEPTLYSALNRALRSGDQSMIELWFGFLKLFHTAMGKLPTVKRTIWRGIRNDIAMHLRESDHIAWGSVSSCSLSIDIITAYLDSDSVLCSIEAINGKSVYGYTPYDRENEVLLLPGTRLRVKKNDYNSSVGLRVVHLVEIGNDSHNISPVTDKSASSINKPSEHDLKSPNSKKIFVSTANLAVNSHVSDTDKSKDDKVFSATTFENGDRYEVAYKNGKKQGYGVYFCGNKELKEGVLADFKAKGKGVRNWTNGDRYKGTFENGQMYGTGTLYSATGYVYNGNWIADEAYGKGTSTWLNGYCYEGDHEKGKIQGYGKFHSPNGDKYQGDLTDGKAQGQGVRIWANGDRYEGNFEDDKKHGFGTYYYKNGGTYTGNWAYDEMSGEGLLRWPSKTQYQGTFKNGKRHGRGKLTFHNGRVQDGCWENDKYMG